MELYQTHEDSDRLRVCVHVQVGSYEPFPLVISTLVLTNYRLNEKMFIFFSNIPYIPSYQFPYLFIYLLF